MGEPIFLVGWRPVGAPPPSPPPTGVPAQVPLGLLAIGPQHGYELKRAHDERLPRTKPLGYGQVYATLGRLTRDTELRVGLSGYWTRTTSPGEVGWWCSRNRTIRAWDGMS